MIIKSIELNNFRIYKGVNRIELTPDKDRNIIIVSGHNGFGKTTFLMSLVWCLYGRQMESVDELYKKEINEKGGYNRYILGSLNKEAQRQGETRFSVSVTFTDVEIPDTTCTEITITRSFDSATNNNDELTILIDGRYSDLFSDRQEEEFFIRDYNRLFAHADNFERIFAVKQHYARGVPLVPDIFPAVFAFGFDPAEGPQLVFVVLPAIFGQMSLSWFSSVLFFSLLCIAAITSTISMMEVAVGFIHDATADTNRPLNRQHSVLVSTVIVTILVVLCILSTTGKAEWLSIGKMNLFDIFDKISSCFMMPLGALGIALFFGWFFFF